MKFGDVIPMGRVVPHRWEECRPSIRALDGFDVRRDQARVDLIWRLTSPGDRMKFHAFLCLGQRTEDNRQVVEEIARRRLNPRA